MLHDVASLPVSFESDPLSKPGKEGTFPAAGGVSPGQPAIQSAVVLRRPLSLRGTLSNTFQNSFEYTQT